ncbi:MAG: hypothetical protein O2931_09330 [Planctomycetota bacterium]|nr:hypothetical protein [Planctomycetota bacterium]MDA1178984.1 hypothetical protein [Planctomycetota bacterium]
MKVNQLSANTIGAREEFSHLHHRVERPSRWPARVAVFAWISCLAGLVVWWKYPLFPNMTQGGDAYDSMQLLWAWFRSFALLVGPGLIVALCCHAVSGMIGGHAADDPAIRFGVMKSIVSDERDRR